MECSSGSTAADSWKLGFMMWFGVWQGQESIFLLHVGIDFFFFFFFFIFESHCIVNFKKLRKMRALWEIGRCFFPESCVFGIWFFLTEREFLLGLILTIIIQPKKRFFYFFIFCLKRWEGWDWHNYLFASRFIWRSVVDFLLR